MIKLYCDNQILFNEQIENNDIYKDKLYYTQNDGLFMYDFTYKESTLLTKEKSIFIKNINRWKIFILYNR